MAHAIQFKPAALRQFEKLPRDAQRRIITKIEALGADPFPSGCKKLSGVPDAWRVRVGSYRIVYQVRREVLLILILAIGDRKDVYR
jgi:mRNA interferase RelE/StbE